MRFAMSLLVMTLTIPTTSASETLASRLAGRILLAVEEHGEAWYINPTTLRRIALGSPTSALEILQSYALGITNENLFRIPEIGSITSGDIALRQSLAGRILLAVEQHGETWYVDPVSLQRVSFANPTEVFRLLASYGLGISSTNLTSVPSSETTDNTQTSSITRIVPFFSQAPLGDWSDPRQADGCEEAAVLMGVAWARGETPIAAEARDIIVAMSDWELEAHGSYIDTSIDDSANWLIKDYLGYSSISVQHDITVDDIQAALANSVVVIAVKGRVLQNPHYVGGGPLRHTILVTGYDSATDEFITNDSGTQFGKNYRYSRATIAAALADYPSGDHVPVTPMPTAMIVISPK